VPPTDLLDVIDHVAFFQTKFFEVDDDLVDPAHSMAGDHLGIAQERVERLALQ
jgi:hypothetical protein